MSDERTEIKHLLQQVESTHPYPIKTTADFEKLGVYIEQFVHEHISTSTLKRLWGYVADEHLPRRYTLDVLSKYIGYSDFKTFCKSAISEKITDSIFFTTFKISSTELTNGDKIEIGWNPNRYLIVEYLGDDRYKVLINQNSKLEVGDEFASKTFLLKFPLFLPNVYRGDETLPSFVGGKDGGLTILSIIK